MTFHFAADISTNRENDVANKCEFKREYNHGIDIMALLQFESAYDPFCFIFLHSVYYLSLPLSSAMVSYFLSALLSHKEIQ